VGADVDWGGVALAPEVRVGADTTNVRIFTGRFRVIDLERDPPDPELSKPGQVDDYVHHLFVPWRREKGKLIVACAEPSPSRLAHIRRVYREPVMIAAAGRNALLEAVETQYRERLSHDAFYALADAQP
jgi:hypothetical protein